MKLLKFTLISILGLSLCTACGGDGDGGETPGPGKPEGPDKSSTTGIDRFDASNIFSRNTYLPDNTAMQGFNLDSDGSVWYTQLSNTNQAQLNWVRAQPNKTPDVQTENKDYMKLTYFGHGTNTALEEDGADRYLWAGAYGVCNAKGQYWNEKLVGRVKYVKGATVKTNECNDYYYIGDYTDLHPSIDAENDLLTINYGDSKNSSYRCFVIYKLSEAKKAPMTNVTITCTDGFWHGASWNFVLWGLLYAVLLLFEKYILRPQARFSVPMHIYTLLFVMLGFVLFDAASVADAFMSFKSMFGFAGIPAVNAASLYYLKSNLVLLIVAAVGATPLPKRIYEKIGGTAGGSRVLAVLTPTAAVAAVAVCTAYLIDGSFNPFVYFRF